MTHQPSHFDEFIVGQQLANASDNRPVWLALQHLMIVFAAADTNQMVLEALCSARNIPTRSISKQDLEDPNFEIEFKTADRVWDNEHRQILVHGAPGSAETAVAVRAALKHEYTVFITPNNTALTAADFLGIHRYLAHGVVPVPIQHLLPELSR